MNIPGASNQCIDTEIDWNNVRPQLRVAVDAVDVSATTPGDDAARSIDVVGESRVVLVARQHLKARKIVKKVEENRTNRTMGGRKIPVGMKNAW